MGAGTGVRAGNGIFVGEEGLALWIYTFGLGGSEPSCDSPYRA